MFILWLCDVFKSFSWWIVEFFVDGDHSNFKEDEGYKLIFLIVLYYMLIDHDWISCIWIEVDLID